MKQHRILVIEDQEDLAELYETTLAGAGYAVVNAFTGEEGVAEFEENGSDAVLLDMTLPEKQGVSVLRDIRAHSANVPVIVITGESSKDLRQQCERLGVHAYLSKPVNYDALLDATRLACEEGAGAGYSVITVRLPQQIVERLAAIDPNIERAITRLCDERIEARRSNAASD